MVAYGTVLMDTACFSSQQIASRRKREYAYIQPDSIADMQMEIRVIEIDLPVCLTCICTLCAE